MAKKLYPVQTKLVGEAERPVIFPSFLGISVASAGHPFAISICILSGGDVVGSYLHLVSVEERRGEERSRGVIYRFVHTAAERGCEDLVGVDLPVWHLPANCELSLEATLFV